MVAFYTLALWSNDYLASGIVKFCQTQILSVTDCSSKTIIILFHALAADVNNAFPYFKGFFTILTLATNFLSWQFEKVKIIKFKV